MKWFLSFIVFLSLVLLSCSHPQFEGTSSFERRRVDDFYMGSGVMQYFLPELPQWARTSKSANCHQDFSVHYLNYDFLMASFSFDYDQAAQFQYSINIELKRRQRDSSTETVPMRDFERLFFDITDRIQSDITVFQVPRFERVHLIWVDPVLQGDISQRRLVNLMNSELMDRGHPIFISFCQQREQVQEFLEEQGFEQAVRIITYEMLSSYDRSGNLLTYRHLDIDALLKDKEIHLFLPQNDEVPEEIKGNFQRQQL